MSYYQLYKPDIDYIKERQILVGLELLEVRVCKNLNRDLIVFIEYVHDLF